MQLPCRPSWWTWGTAGRPDGGVMGVIAGSRVVHGAIAEQAAEANANW
ncbi:MAG: hypothetical protein H7287_11040 [Thermoleophilia bacterium]|nr:hypothetical protein [Thermoleophilia bacterium]